MKTILYEIPDKYFPGYRVRVPFRVKVRYEVREDKVCIMELCFSPECLRCMTYGNVLVDEIQRELQAAEKKVGNIHPVMEQALAPFTNR